jgi:hypothetical protein
VCLLFSTFDLQATMICLTWQLWWKDRSDFICFDHWTLMWRRGVVHWHHVRTRLYLNQPIYSVNFRELSTYSQCSVTPSLCSDVHHNVNKVLRELSRRQWTVLPPFEVYLRERTGEWSHSNSRLISLCKFPEICDLLYTQSLHILAQCSAEFRRGEELRAAG